MGELFEHTFQRALFGVGALLCIAGIAAAFLDSPAALEGGFAEALSEGFAAFFMALFAGSLIGVGVAMAADALILGLRGNKAHVGAAALFSLLSLFIAASAAAESSAASFPLFVLFFAGLSASGAFMLSAAVFGLSALFLSFAARAGRAEKAQAGRSRAAKK